MGNNSAIGSHSVSAKDRTNDAALERPSDIRAESMTIQKVFPADNPFAVQVHESEVCVDADCVCGPGCERCDESCTDTARDPATCGTCDRGCAPGELCEGGQCVCGPGLVPNGTDCVDPSSDPDACVPVLLDCYDPSPYCQNGACVASCSGEEVDACGYACVYTEHDSRHCGECFRSCEAD